MDEMEFHQADSRSSSRFVVHGQGEQCHLKGSHHADNPMVAWSSLNSRRGTVAGRNCEILVRASRFAVSTAVLLIDRESLAGNRVHNMVGK